ncbi:MAG: polyprenol monophosphomannose synthase [Chloroflexota bacterium]
MPRSVVVIPTYNEADNLPTLLERIYKAGDYEVLIVDDGSPDGTGDLAEELGRGAHAGRLSVLHRTQKEGLGPAYIAGFRKVLAEQCDFIYQMDADLSHDPAGLNALRAALTEADVAIGSRYVAGGGTVGWPRRRLLLSSWGSFYARTVLGLPVRDLTGGFKGFRRRALQAVDFSRIGTKGYGFQIETTYQLHRQGFRLVEVPIVFSERQLGTSKMSLGIVAEAMFLPWRLALPAWQNALLEGIGPSGARIMRAIRVPVRSDSDRDGR